MAKRVVVGLEMIGIDHQERDRSLLAHGAPPFDVDDGIELAAVPQPRERIRRRHLLELAFGLGAPPDLAREHERRSQHEQRECQHHGADAERLPLPECEHCGQGLARHHEQRSAVAAADIEPRRRIDRALSE